jgi:hypothetical protein
MPEKIFWIHKSLRSGDYFFCEIIKNVGVNWPNFLHGSGELNYAKFSYNHINHFINYGFNDLRLMTQK